MSLAIHMHDTRSSDFVDFTVAVALTKADHAALTSRLAGDLSDPLVVRQIIDIIAQTTPQAAVRMDTRRVCDELTLEQFGGALLVLSALEYQYLTQQQG